MKKSILAVAVAAALPAAAFAQSNVTMYGIADASIEFSSKGANANNKSDVKMIDGLQSGSRWGVEGVEDLGGGLAATFRFEAGVDVDSGAGESLFIGRQARVGLKGAFGEVRLGRQYDPLFYAALNNDFTGYGWYNNHYGIAGSAGRWSNEVEYRNKFGGFEIVAGWAPGEVSSTGGATPTVSDPKDSFGIAGIFQSAAWGVNAGYQTQGGGDTTVGGTTTTTKENKIFQVGGNVGFGPARLGLSYGQNDLAGANGDRKDLYASFALKIGAAGEAVLNYKKIDNPTGATPDADLIGLSYGHAMSKRTNWYVSVGFDKLKSQQAGVADPEDVTKVALGIRHKF